jgi:biopolymer transport protein ExbD
MKIKPVTDLKANIENIAMTDIITNMFIFFFISFSLLYTFNPAHQSKIKVNLPEASLQSRVEIEPIVISITREGQVYLGNQMVSLDALSNYLYNAKARREPALAEKEEKLLVRGDRDIKYDTVVQVLDTIKHVGIEKIGLATLERVDYAPKPQ